MSHINKTNYINSTTDLSPLFVQQSTTFENSIFQIGQKIIEMNYIFNKITNGDYTKLKDLGQSTFDLKVLSDQLIVELLLLDVVSKEDLVQQLEEIEKNTLNK